MADDTERELADLRAEVARLRAEKGTYGLRFSAHPEPGVAQQVLSGGVTVPMLNPELCVGNENAPRHHWLYEGDNLGSLLSLSQTHAHQMNVIYIDPPYNTASKDFTYHDDYADSIDGFRHSSWLSFMRPRLRLARDLLAEDGFIAISINDKELATLRLLSDEVFGEHNFLGMMVWQSRGMVPKTPHFGVLTEYILFYARNKARVKMTKRLSNLANYKGRDEHYEEWGGYQTRTIDGSSLRYNPNQDMPIVFEGRTYYAGGVTEEQWRARRERAARSSQTRGLHSWVWSERRIQWGIEQGIVFARNGRLHYKYYERADKDLKPCGPRTQAHSNLIPSTFVTTASGTSEVKRLFGSRAFTYPKPTKLLCHIIGLHPNKDALVLDFFAGSGSTGHAVLEMNKKDGGNRRFILATDNSNTDGVEADGIARTITGPRIQKVISGVWADGKKHPSHPDDALDYYVMEVVGTAQEPLCGPVRDDGTWDAAGYVQGVGDAVSDLYDRGELAVKEDDR